MGRLTATRATVLVVVGGALGLATIADGATMVRNGDFTNGSDGVPAEWRNDAWARDSVQFSWTRPDAGEHGSAGIHNVEPNDARWCQTVSVEPGGTYRVVTRARTEGVGTDASGAHLAIEPRIADSPDLRGTHDWQPLEIVVRAGDESQWDVCVRLGSYANLNTGAAWFTDVAVVPLGVPVTTTPAGRTFARVWDWARASGRGAGLPLLGGALLALGLGIIRAPRRS
jgi:hypothetical protein